MIEVLGPPDRPRRAHGPRLPPVSLAARRVALAAATVLGVGMLAATHDQVPHPSLLVASTALARVDATGHVEPLALPGTGDPARLLRLSHATVLLTRPAGRIEGGQALLLPDGGDALRVLGPADSLVPDSREDRVWLVQRIGDQQALTSYDGSGRAGERRTAATGNDLFLVTPEGVLDDEMELPGGSTPTLRDDAGLVLRRFPGPVTVLAVTGSRVLATQGNCLDGCSVLAWDVRDGGSRSAPLDAGLVVLEGALSADGRSVALAARSASAGQDPVGTTGQAVLLRGRLDGGEPVARTVRGGCTLLACHVTFSGSTVWASVDRSPGRLVRWRDGEEPLPIALQVPDVQALSGLS